MSNDPQTADAVLLVRPVAFGFHAEAAASNAFAAASTDPEVGLRAAREFDAVADRLAAAGVDVLILEDSPDVPKPDAIFPNNWVSFHADGTMVLYPMATEARRQERNTPGVKALLQERRFEVRRVLDLSSCERVGHFLEGTGSLVLDRQRRRAFASLSPRTTPAAVEQFDHQLGYSTFAFDARDRSGRPVYHTNVLLSLGAGFAVLCRDVVDQAREDALIGEIETSDRILITVDYEQLRNFACNLIELRNRAGEPVIALSSAALASFRADQKRQLERFGQLVDVPIPTIEAVGGGSVRCMIAEVHLPRA
jgi:hypothetical protein